MTTPRPPPLLPPPTPSGATRKRTAQGDRCGNTEENGAGLAKKTRLSARPSGDGDETQEKKGGVKAATAEAGQSAV